MVAIEVPGAIIEGEPATMNAQLSASLQNLVSGGASLAWQWQLDGVDITGATTSTYTIVSVGWEASGAYTATATIVGVDYISGPSTLVVEVPQLPDPDLDTLVENDGLTIDPSHIFFGYVPKDSSVEQAVQITNTSTTV